MSLSISRAEYEAKRAATVARLLAKPENELDGMDRVTLALSADGPLSENHVKYGVVPAPDAPLELAVVMGQGKTTKRRAKLQAV